MSVNYHDLSKEFITFCIDQQVLKFGEFNTKAGRLSPYFFNAGLFNDGDSLLRLGEFYANSIEKSDIAFDMLFGPAYKGIPLVASIAIAFAKKGRNLPYAYNRKEAKDHGEGGTVVGAPLSGRVLIIDDVISAGTSVRESVDLIHAHGATACGVSIALDRQEKGLGALSATQEVEQNNNMPVISIAKLSDLLAHIESSDALTPHLDAIKHYQARYCLTSI
jgi:orotate phosphoribosyltransferase